MDTDTLRRTLAQDSDNFTPELIERAIEALTGTPGADGLPDLGFLPAHLQVMVLAAQYQAFFKQGPVL